MAGGFGTSGLLAWIAAGATLLAGATGVGEGAVRGISGSGTGEEDGFSPLGSGWGRPVPRGAVFRATAFGAAVSGGWSGLGEGTRVDSAIDSRGGGPVLERTYSQAPSSATHTAAAAAKYWRGPNQLWRT